jgi:hypothetical protein
LSDNLSTQSAAPATPPAATGIATRSVTYSGDASQSIAPVGLVAFAGADDAKSVFDLGAESGYHKVAAGSNNADTVKASAGILRGVHVFNLAAYPVYVKFYNKASAPNPAADTPILTVGVQAGTQRDVPISRYLSTGIAIAMVKGIGEADNTALIASDCVTDIDYV